MSEIILKVNNISKQYRLGLVGTGTLSHDLNRWWSKVRGKDDPFLKIGELNDRSTKGSSDYVWALKDINFEVKRGEVLGIIGKNGAGKSTLLKILSKVTGPTTGSINSNGRIASLLEVGTGFHPEMTGRENIFLNGAILGMTKKEIRSKEDEIIDFSGCQRYIDTPVKRYSSGMTVRLAFAVAAHLEPDILVIDEVLAVGDAEFQKKAIGKMQDISKGEGRTVLFVSHNMAAVKSLCSRGIVLENGEIKMIGNTNNVIDFYLSRQSDEESFFLKRKVINKDIYFKHVLIQDNQKIRKTTYSYSEKIRIKIGIEYNKFHKNSSLYVMLLTKSGHRVFSAETKLIQNKRNYNLLIHENFLARGYYYLELYLHIPKKVRLDTLTDVCSFNIIEEDSEFVIHGSFDHGVVFGKYEWEILNDKENVSIK